MLPTLLRVSTPILPQALDPAINAVTQAAGSSGWGYWDASTFKDGVAPDSFGNAGREMTETGGGAALSTVESNGRTALAFGGSGTNYLQGSEALSEYAFLHAGNNGADYADVFIVTSRTSSVSGNRSLLASTDGAGAGINHFSTATSEFRPWFNVPAAFGPQVFATSEGGFDRQELFASRIEAGAPGTGYRTTRAASESENSTGGTALANTETADQPLTIGARGNGSQVWVGEIWAVVILKNATEAQRAAVEIAIREQYLGQAPVLGWATISAWFNPSGIVESGGVVSAWNDSSGNNNTATPTTTGSPALGSLGGNVAIDTTSGALITGPWNQGADTSPQTIISVYDAPSGGANYFVYDGISGGSDPDRVTHFADSTTIYFNAGTSRSVADSFGGDQSPRIAVHHAGNVTGVAGGSLEQNGFSVVNFATSGQGTRALNGIRIGEAFNGTQQLPGNIGEIIVFADRISDRLSGLYSMYLRSKFDINATP